VVDVVITDVNDNSPRFERAVYDVEITEHAPPQRNVIVVRSGTQGCNWAMIRPMSCHKIAGWGGEKGWDAKRRIYPSRLHTWVEWYFGLI